ncbi:carbohydrate kinase family protein [Halovenus rubra]|uniref:Carbohydrate kinase family protein n=2 Tax=Halovenus rubra TaxID=869890 RepID=A0ACC7E1A4_9EURY|nr:carbohydrate kinase family protein [Halovenus rubra]
MTGQTVICAGHVNWDVTLYVDRLPAADGEAAIVNQSQNGGGSASNTAYMLASLGCAPVLLGSTGDDEYGALVRNELTDVGVDCRHLEYVDDGITTVKYLIVDESGEVMVLASDGANETFTSNSLSDDTFDSATHLHLTSQRPDTAYDLAKRAVDAGIPVSFDPGRRLDLREYQPIYRLADILFLNENEATAVKQADVLDGAEGITVIKHGAEGATAESEELTVSHAGYETEPVDTTGAGDAFGAGFIAATLNDKPLERALAVGNACGALTTQCSGARSPLSWSDIESLIDG